MLSTPPHLANLQNPSLKQIDSRFQNLDKLANLDKQSKKKQTPAIYRLRHMEVAEKPPRLAQQGGWAPPRARGECRGGAAMLPLANYSHGGGGKNPRGSHNKEVGRRLGHGGSAEGEPCCSPLRMLTNCYLQKKRYH